ncbi:MAG: hypothetical protein CMJ54_08615 [Planctomycetaceae bacterium]|nr:hypothetical protein [Planctomycetaceae bacterium]
MSEHDRPETEESRSSSAAGDPGWLDGVIAGFMNEELTDTVDASADTAAGDPPRAWIAEGRSRIDGTMAALLAPIIRKAMEEIPDDVNTRLERIESRLEAIERLLADR